MLGYGKGKIIGKGSFVNGVRTLCARLKLPQKRAGVAGVARLLANASAARFIEAALEGAVLGSMDRSECHGTHIVKPLYQLLNELCPRRAEGLITCCKYLSCI